MISKSVVENNYIGIRSKSLRHKNNKEFVTVRANIINNRKVFNISIGNTICELIGFKKSDKVNVYFNKYDRDLIIIKKDNDIGDGYALHSSGSGANFLRFSFRYDSVEQFKLSQTLILDYDINEDGLLLINIGKLKWSK